MNATAAGHAPPVRRLARPGGVVAYEVAGTGPLIVCVPGMGQLRSSYRFIAATLRDAGFRVALTDLRGHGDSDVGFAAYGDEATAGDITALIDELGGPAIIVGNSLAGGSAVLVAASRPELVAGLVLIGPFVRPAQASRLMQGLFRLMMAPEWARPMWKAYLPKLYAGSKPADFEHYRHDVDAAMKRRGYTRAFSLTTRTTHDAAAQALASVNAPTLVVMGKLDPDFSDPTVEAQWIAGRLHGEVLLVDDAGHYPQAQQPDVVGPAIVTFVKKVTSHA